ncbi:MAG: glycosyltransferase family 9 protein [Candidatus Tectomicrobia bacterium]|nr:glycosyltransferase family 9 protein [Candidatus Tectomicrobia bacterium]
MSATKVHRSRSVKLEDLRRILLIRLSSLGDVLLMTPLLNLLHRACPHAEIDVLTKFEYHDLLRSHPAITRLLPFESDQPLRRTLSALRDNTYDLALDLHCTPRSQLLLRMLRSRRKLTYNKRVLRRAMLVRLGWNTLRNSTPVPELYAAPLRRLGLEGHLGPPTMHLGYESLKAAEEHIASSLPGGFDRPLLAVAPGARWPTKRWPVDRFAAVAQAMAQEKGAAVVVLGGADESVLASALCDNLDVPFINAAGTLTLMHSAAMLSRCRLLISNDSGLMHMATALRVPVVAIFGPTVREFGFYPFGAPAEVVSEPLPCRPCSTKGSMRCPRSHHACMQDVSSARVLAAVRNLWKSNNE